jgi:preprotein translocase subunit SecA
MELLTEIWDRTTDAFTAFSERVSEGLVRVFGNYNERAIRKLRPAVARINELEPRMQALSDAELRELTPQFRQRLEQGETLDDILVEAFAAAREAGRRFLKMRHYDVQLLGGMVLHGGNIAEMVTGEGKTLVATLPAYLNALEGKGVHVVTVNDYLARRDAEWMSPLYQGLGLTVGAIQAPMESRERKQIYQCDITYGTNNEFGFDYLRDNMKPTREQQCQRALHYAIIDEVDSILVDEARTPLIISGPAFDDVKKYAEADRIARQLKVGVHFEVKEKERTAHLNDEGVREAERLAGIESFYTPGNMEWPHLIDNALKAHHLYRKDRDYIVNPKGEIVIVDEFTGRLMEGRQWSDGLHQAVEAKERVRIKEENQTLATITLQNYFKLYKKLAGMTGTAMTEANEFSKVYKLDVFAIPTNRQLTRVAYPDVIYRTEREKYNAIIQEIREVHETGRPILVGTTSIEKSELISDMLAKYGISHQVLNAKYHESEAEIVAQAGRKGMVTIATNMAGRGTDIILGGNPEFMAWADLKRLTNEDGRPLYPTRLEVPPQVWKQAVEKYEPSMREEGREVASAGGLHVIGTERHESRRIDNQLRGRTGRQGDPGSSRFFLSLEDDLMRKFAGEWVSAMLTRLGMQEGEAIESGMVTRRIEGAQKKVEERNFDIRKNLLEYDEVMDEQRKRVYSFRQAILDGSPTKDVLLEMIDGQIQTAVDRFLADDYGPASFAEFVDNRLGIEIEPKEFKNASFEDARRQAIEEAESNATEQIREAMEEHLPDEADPTEWNWQAMTSWANTRYGLNVKDRDLRAFAKTERGRDGETRVDLDREALSEFLREKAVESIHKVDLAPAAEFLAPDWGRRSLAGWVHYKFGLPLDPSAWTGQTRADVAKRIQEEVRALYARKDAEFPVQVGLTRFLAEKTKGGVPRYDKDGLAHWATERFNQPIDAETIRPMLRADIEAMLLRVAQQSYRGNDLAAELERLWSDAFPPTPPRAEEPEPDHAALVALAAWAHESLGVETTPEELRQLGRKGTRNKLMKALDARWRPEMAELEKVLLLQILDNSWMEHLRTMDHLRSSVGLRTYAQVDPKVEYKREGMRIFEQMWSGVGDKVTDLLFRVESFDPEFLNYLGARWQLERARTIHEAVPSDFGATSGSADAASGASATRGGSATATANTKTDVKKEPLRNQGKKVGRNDPCPCGSGKKFKNCCMHKQSADLF